MKQSCDQPPTPDEPSTRASPNDDLFYAMYPTESYDLSNNSGPGAAAANGQLSAEFSATCEVDCGYPPLSWDAGLFKSDLSLPLNSPGTADPGEGLGLESPGPWDGGIQLYPDLMSGSMAMTYSTSPQISVEEDLSRTYNIPRHDTVAVADSMPQYVPVEEPQGGRSDSFKWPPPQAPPKGQISPSPSQSSYYTTSSPANRGGAPHSSKHNSCSSLPTLKISALNSVRPELRPRPVSVQALSPDEARPSPAGTVASKWPDPSRASSTSAQNYTSSATTTTDYSVGIVSPAMTPSPRNRTTTFADQPAPRAQAARHESDLDSSPPKTNRLLKPKTAAPTQKKKQQQDTTEGQAQQQPPQSAPQARRYRETVNRSRAKSRQAAVELEASERALRSENRELSATARGLRDEVLKLKNELLAHGNCDDPLIQQYLTSQARKVGYGAAQQAQEAQKRLHQQCQQGRGHAES